MDNEYMICKERAEWIGAEIGRDIARRLQLGEMKIVVTVRNDDPGLDYVMVSIGSNHDDIMVDAQDEWRRREEEEYVKSEAMDRLSNKTVADTSERAI